MQLLKKCFEIVRLIITGVSPPRGVVGSYRINNAVTHFSVEYFWATKSSLEIRLIKPPRNTTPMSNPLGLSLRNPRGLTVFVGGLNVLKVC